MTGLADPIIDEIDDALRHIAERAKTEGVSISVDFDSEAIHIADIARDRANPQTKGAGARVIREVFIVADRYGVPVDIENMTDEIKLGAHYASLGFAPFGEPGLITNRRRLPSTNQLAQEGSA